MKLMLFMLLTLVTTFSFAQWEYKLIDNGFDDPYKFTSCVSLDHKKDNIAVIALFDIKTTVNYDSLLISIDTIKTKIDSMTFYKGEWIFKDTILIDVVPKYSFKTKNIISYAFIIANSYNQWYGDTVLVDISYIINNKYKKYHIISNVQNINDSQVIVLSDNILIDNMLNDFKDASSLKIRINLVYEKIYQFNMSGSANVLNFIQKDN